jgi:hypothetical protein
MATEAAANPIDSGSDSVQPSDGLDNSPDDLDFEELEEEATPQPEPDETDSNSETDEALESQEAEEPETEEAASTSSKEPDDSIIVAMPDGEKLELKELKNGYLRDKDYRHKTTEIANKRRDLEALSTRVSQSANAISEVLMKQVPPAPDVSLSITDPIRFMQEKAQHEAALGIVNSIVEQATSAGGVVNTLTREQQTENIQSEVAKLTEAFPQVKTPEGKKKFFEASLGAARELGFSDQELNGISDHRMFRVAYYAKLGLEAEAAKAKAATKVVNVPPVAMQKRQPGQTAAKARQNQDAVKKLARSGSIHDAMAVDFE